MDDAKGIRYISPMSETNEPFEPALDEQEKTWTANKFMVLLVATLAVALTVIITAANASGP